jgi:hypothetical protein
VIYFGDLTDKPIYKRGDHYQKEQPEGIAIGDIAIIDVPFTDEEAVEEYGQRSDELTLYRALTGLFNRYYPVGTPR